jgi:hypothetical protein
MTMITPARVIQAIETYYEGGVLGHACGEVGATSGSPVRNGAAAAPAARRDAASSRPDDPGVAVTIGVGPYAHLAQLAARELGARTGLRTVVLGDREFEGSGFEWPHYLKFRLFDLIDAENLLYFDADIVCLEAWDPRAYFGSPAVVAVREGMVEVVRRESAEWGVPSEEHFNSGMMILNRRHHLQLLNHAESLRSLRPTCLYEQLPLNAARVRLGVPVKLLDRRYNWVGFGESTLSNQMPVVMAHKLVPGRPDINTRYLSGDYELAPPRITLNEAEARRLCGSAITYSRGDGSRSALRLRDDGTVLPAADPAGPGYWFVEDVKGRPTLALAAETAVLGRFVQTVDGLWTSTATGDPARCVNESVYKKVTLTEHNARSMADEFLRSAPPWPEDRFRGRGIVMCSGDKYFPSAWVCIRMLRHLGCELPIELWQLSEQELGAPLRRLLEPYAVRCVDASEVRQRHPVRQLNGWELKPYAMLHSAFEEVLWLDADNVPVRDPTFLFDAEPYRRQGAAFWPDFGRLGPERAIWRICQVAYADEPEFETGQVVLNKRQCWHALQLTMHLNEHSDFYYRHVHGDKETFHMAWRMLGRDYAMVPTPPHPLKGTMCQHDFEGRRLFQHRNTAKWRLRGGNRRVEGFELEAVCLGFLDELAGKVDARHCSPLVSAGQL